MIDVTFPPSTVRPSWVPQELFPFTSRYLRVGGALVHYIDEGTGPAVLFLHGNPTWSFLYRDIVRRLSDRFRCIALDYPGFGLSEAPEAYDFRPASHARVVEAFVEELDLSGLTLMMQDWGGPIGFAVAARQPHRFRRFVIGNTWAWPLNGDPHFERFAKLLGGRVGGLLIRRFNAFVNVMVPAGARRRLPRAVMDAYRGPFLRPETRRATHVFPRELLESRDFLAEVEAGVARLGDRPALIVWGERDFGLRAREREYFERLFPNHRTVLLENASHFIQEDAPSEIADAIRDWVPAEERTGRDEMGACSVSA